MTEINHTHLTDRLMLPPHLEQLYVYVKRLSSGDMTEGGPPAPFDRIDIPDGLLGDFMEAVEQIQLYRQKWEKLPESTDDVVIWKLPNGRVFRETFDSQGNLLRFTFV